MDKATTFAIAAGITAGLVLFYSTRKSIAEAADTVNPINNDNVFARGADAIVTKASGGKFLSIGDFIFQVFNDEPKI